MPFQDRPSLIAKYAASAKTIAQIPLPTTVSLFQLAQTSARSDPPHPFTLPALQACMLLRQALRERHETITLTGSPKTMLSAVIESALDSLHYKRACNVQVGLWENLASDLFSRFDDARGLASKQFVLVVDDAHLLPFSALQLLMLLSEEPERFSIQVLLAGQRELGDGLTTGHRNALASRIRAKVVLGPDVAKKPKARIEDDLVRGWQSAETARRHSEAPPVRTGSTVSPFPVLAALLGQSAPKRSPSRARRLFAVVVVAVLVLCLFGGLMVSHRI